MLQHATSLFLAAAFISAVAGAPGAHRSKGGFGLNKGDHADAKQSVQHGADDLEKRESTGNDPGGHVNGNLTIQSVCRRSLETARSLNHLEHSTIVKRTYDQHHHQHHATPPPPRPRARTVNNHRHLKVDNSKNTNLNVALNQKTPGAYNTNITNNDTRTNNASANNNSGIVAGFGVICSRALQEVEIERQELGTGASVLAALGGGHKSKDVTSPSNILATRDLGRLAHVLQVRALGYDKHTATHYERDVGLECISSPCDDQTRREAEDMLAAHARRLGFSFSG